MIVEIIGVVDCNQCARRGKLNGLSQETYCSGCIYSDRWKKDYFVESKNQCDGCNAGIYKDAQGMHRDENSNPIMVCQEHRYT